MVRVLMVIANNGFRDEELYDPLEVFEQSGYKVDIAAPLRAEAKGMLGAIVQPHLAIKDAKVYEYDAVVLVGGQGAMKMQDNPELLRLVKDAFDRHKTVAAICVAPAILARAGVLNGKKSTVSQSSEILRLYKQLNLELVNQPVVISGRVITANGPAAAKEFGKAVAQSLI